MNYIEAIDYVSAYADFQKIPFDDVLDINNSERFRGSVYNIEFEYNSNSKILIARGYVYQGDKSNLRADIWNKIQIIEQYPDSSIVQQLFPGKKLNFLNKRFEIDSTINEIAPKQLYRLNLRMDFSDNSLSKNQFVKHIKDLAEESLLWDKNYFLIVVKKCNSELFPVKAKSYVESFALSKGFPKPLWNESNEDIMCNLKDLTFKYNKKSMDFFIYKKFEGTANDSGKIAEFNQKNKDDSLWYYRASLNKVDNNLYLTIIIGDYRKTDKEVMEIIDYCTHKVDLWISSDSRK